MKKIIGFFDKLHDVFYGIACVLLLTCVAFVNVTVVLRYCFHISFQWTEEISRYLHIGVVILLLGPLLWKGNHINMDLILMKLKGKGRKILRLIGEFASLALVGFTFYQSVGYVASLKESGILTFSSKFEQWMPTAIIPIGFLFGTVFLLALIIKELYEFNKAEVESNEMSSEIETILKDNDAPKINEPIDMINSKEE